MARTQDTREMRVGQTTHHNIPTEGNIRDADLSEQGIQTVDAVGYEDYAKALAFMEEPVTVIVHESVDPNEPPIVDLYVNGVPQWFIRGKEITVKRKYVQLLCDMKQQRISTDTGIEGGRVVNKVNKFSSLRFPFSVREDKNPNGAAWLTRELQRA